MQTRRQPTYKLDTHEQSKRKNLVLAQLEEDKQALRKYSDMMSSTDEVADKMMNILTEFDQRLMVLEASAGPINRSTQKLTRIFNNVEKVLGSINTVMNYMDMGGANSSDALAFTSTPEEDLNSFLESVRKIRDGLQHLQHSKLGGTQRAVTELRNMLDKAVFQMTAAYRKWIQGFTVPIDYQIIHDKDISMPPGSVLTNLTIVAGELTSIVIQFNDLSSFKPLTSTSDQPSELPQMRGYADIRSNFINQTLKPIITQSHLFLAHLVSQDTDTIPLDVTSQHVSSLLSSPTAKFSNQIYTNRTCPFLVYSRTLFKLMTAEKDIINRILPKKLGLPIQTFQATTNASLETLLDVLDIFLNKIRKAIASRKEVFMAGTVSDCTFCLLDVLECYTILFEEYSDVLTYAGKKTELSEFYTSGKELVVILLKEFNDDIKKESKGSALSVDGTVSELTAVTLNALKKFLDYMTLIDTILSDQQTLTFSNMRSLCVECIESLVAYNEKKAAQYIKLGKTVLAQLFLLNNFYYMSKFLKNSKLLEVCGEAVDYKIAFLCESKRNEYFDGWKSCCEYLMDVTLVQNGVIQKTLSKQQKDDIKEKFKSFNAAFDERHATERTYVIPDPELRQQIVRNIKKTVGPLYTRFYEKYKDSDFSKTPQKYCKYDKKQLEECIDEFFDAS